MEVTSKKGYSKILGHSCFLEYHCLLSVFRANSGSYGRHSLFELSTPLLTQGIMRLPDTLALISHTLWDPGIPCSWGIMSLMCEWDHKKQVTNTHLAHFSLAQVQVSVYHQTSVIKHKFKDNF